MIHSYSSLVFIIASQIEVDTSFSSSKSNGIKLDPPVHLDFQVDPADSLEIVRRRFLEKHPKFIGGIVLHAPEISERELEHAIYCVLKIKAKSVAKDLFVSCRTVENFRYLLKKKIGLKKDQKLHLFLRNLI